MSIFDTPRHSTEAVARAASLEVGRLKSALARGDLGLPTPELEILERPGVGRSRLFSDRRALHIATAAELIRVGLSARAASAFALLFTDTNAGDGEAASAILGDAPSEPDRMPGGLFADDRTVLRVATLADGSPAAHVFRLQTVCSSPFVVGHKRCTSFILVDLNAVVARVSSALGVEIGR